MSGVVYPRVAAARSSLATLTRLRADPVEVEAARAELAAANAERAVSRIVSAGLPDHERAKLARLLLTGR